jgi:ubiquitin-like 1-activating enzyme E1 B
VGIVDGSILKVDDFLQNYELTVNINHYEAKDKEDPPFKFIANPADLKTKQEGDGNFFIIIFFISDFVTVLGIKNGISVNTSTAVEKQQIYNKEDDDDLVICPNDNDDFKASSSKRRKLNPVDEDDDIMVVEDVVE